MLKGIIIGAIITYSILNPDKVYNLLNGIKVIIANDQTGQYFEEGYNHIK